MSRTTNVELTQARRSKRLLLNGYYQLPPGESPQRSELSSEDDDDTASVDSNASSLYSERAVHYNESPTILHRRRRRKAHESPRSGVKLGLPRSDPVLVKVTPKKRAVQKVTLADSAPGAQTSSSFMRQEHSATLTSSRSQTTRESKVTVTSVRSSSHRYARGETSTMAQSLLQQSLLNRSLTNVNNDAQHAAAATERQDETVNLHSRGEGDHARTHITDHVEMESSATSSTSYMNNRLSHRRADESHKERGDANIAQYSSAESEGEEVYKDFQGKHYGALVPILFSKFIATVLDILSWVGSGFGYVCRAIYQVTLSIFVFDVWWLSRSTSPFIAKVLRFLLLLLLLFLLLSGGYFATRHMLKGETEEQYHPFQSVSTVFSMLSRKVNALTVWSSSKEERREAPTVQSPPPPQFADPSSYAELKQAMYETELRLGDKLVKMGQEIDALRKQQVSLNKKQEESFTNDLKTLEKTLDSRILKLRTESDTEMADRLQVVKDEIALVRRNHTSSLVDTRAEIEQLRSLLSDRSQTSVKVQDFRVKLDAFNARLTALNDMMMQSRKEFDKHVVNTTNFKEIAKMQFIESFLDLIKSDKKLNQDQTTLHFLFVAWLEKQGFLRVEEVDRKTNIVEVNVNKSMETLEKRLFVHIEKIRKILKQHTSTLTLERIVERPLTAPSGTGASGSTESQVREWIRQELDVYSADRIALADHALESAGGFVVSTRCSESYNRKTALVSLLGIPIYYNINTPRSVIQASTLPGECWSFKGSEGYIVIALSGAIHPTSFTLEHIPRELSPHGRIDSAPKDFTVLGLADSYDYTGVVLGKFRYEEDGPVIQQFAASNVDEDQYFTHVELRVTSNWGHPEYTCLYRFRVHGTRRESGDPLI